MKETIRWLSKVEKEAANFYGCAADLFAEDRSLASFLDHLAKEEFSHYLLLRKATEGLGDGRLPHSSILLDAATRSRIDDFFAAGRARLSAGGMTSGAMMELIAAAEFSEWNDIFLYAMSVLRGFGRDYQEAAAEIDRHRQGIETFFAAREDGRAHLESLRRLAPVWNRRILVIDDEQTITRLLRYIFKSWGEVVTADNGRQGVEQITQGHFDVIICDMEMPEMNGRDFYLQALKIDPKIAGRILFFTGSMRSENEDFIRKERLPHLPKPVSLDRLRRNVADLAALGGRSGGAP